jgi:hypothetical protein
MRRVYKYPIPNGRTAKFSIPLENGFKFLRVAYQGEQLQMWCEVEDGATRDFVEFELYGTGHDIKPGAKYITTFDIGPLVMHMYQISHLSIGK